jgi:hypothetical protein
VGDDGDLRLLPASPCIDAGNNSAVPSGITTDLTGNPRFAYVPGVADSGSGTAPIVDMGAYESPNPSLVVVGTSSPDEFSLSLSPDQTSIRIAGPGGSSTYSVLAITALTVNGGEGDDRLTVDFANGNPVPAGGVMFDGQGGSDGVRIVAPGSNATLTGEQVSVGTAAAIGFGNTEGTSFDLGAGRLTKSGSGTAVLVGGSICAVGTEVLGGTLVVGQARTLPAGGGVTIGAGATVVLPSGLIQAAVADPGCAVPPASAGCGPWQVDSRPWTVDCPLSIAYGPPSPVQCPPSTCLPDDPRSAVFQDRGGGGLAKVDSGKWAVDRGQSTVHGLLSTVHCPPSTRRALDALVQSADVQRWQPLARLVAGERGVKRKAAVQTAVDLVLAALWP